LLFSERIKDVAASGTRRIFDLSQGMPGLVNLGIGEPDFITPKFVRDALKEATDAGFNRYTPNRGTLELRSQLAKKLKWENGIDAEPGKEVIVTAGATQAILVLMCSLLNEGDEVVIPTPAFPAYQAAVRLAGGTPVEVPMSEAGGYALDTKRLEKAYTKHTKLLVLNSPGNPTGVVYSRDDIVEACAGAAANKLLILSDEIYEKFIYRGASHFSPASVSEFKERVVTVNGFSKTFAITGWRLGYAVANENVIDAMTRYNMYNAVCASSIAQVAAVAALRGPKSFLGPIIRDYDRRRKMVCKSLDEIGMQCIEPKGAFYAFPRIDCAASSEAFSYDFLSRHKVATVPGSSFGRGGEGHIRISYSVSEEKLMYAMDRLSKFRRELGENVKTMSPKVKKKSRASG
jgi:aminotransferase